MLRTFDLTHDDESEWGWGVGCRGKLEVFIETRTTGRALANILSMARNTSRNWVLATAIESSSPDVAVASRWLLTGSGAIVVDTDIEPLTPLIRSAASRLSSAASEIVDLSMRPGHVRLHVERIDTPEQLLICGTGGDVAPMAALADFLGWNVLLTGGHGSMTADNFPASSRLIVCEPDDLAHQVLIDSRTSAVIATHNFALDRAYLRSLLQTDAGYIGIVTSRSRMIDLIQCEFDGTGRQTHDRVFGPVGLNLQAEGPEEIALAVIAEILCWSRGGSGTSLRDEETLANKGW